MNLAKSLIKIDDINFQSDAIDELLLKTEVCLMTKEDKLLFTAPVGSGKTIVGGVFMDKFIKKMINEHNEDYAFVWISPGTGGLLNQSKESIESFVTGQVRDLGEIMSQGEILPGDMFFVNWESIRNKDNIVRQDGDRKNLDRIVEDSNVKLIALIDEAHQSIGAKNTDDALDMLNPVLSIHITATPKLDLGFSKTNTVKINLADVISKGIIKKRTLINQGLKNNSKEDIIEKAIEQREKIEKEMEKVDRKTNLKPLVLIQIANDSNAVDSDNAEMINNAVEIKNLLFEKGIENSKIGIWLSKDVNSQNIEEDIRTSDIEYLIFKQAIVTGWDCPRAHILVRLRETKSAIFDIQTIGRILRTVERKHYDNDLIDSAYIYTEYDDLEYKLEVDKDMEDRIMTEENRTVLKDKFKNRYKEVTLHAENIDKTSNYSINTEIFVKEVIEELEKDLPQYKISTNALKKDLLMAIGETKDLEKEDKFLKKEIIKVDKTEVDIREEYSKSIQSLYSKYDLSRVIRNVLMNHQDNDGSMDIVRKLYISNKEQINGKIKEVIEKYEKTTKTSIPQLKLFNFIDELYYKDPKLSKGNYSYTKVPDLSVDNTGSLSEEKFASWLKTNKNIEWWLKNEPYGESFSIAYSYKYNLETFNALYYPDFMIIDKKNNLYIIDTKAPDNKKDYPYVKEKYEAGKAYEYDVNIRDNGNKHFTNIIFSIVKYKEGVPFIAIGDNYSEDTNNPKFWIRFDEYIQKLNI